MSPLNSLPARLPPWLKRKALAKSSAIEVSKNIGKAKLYTVCHEARCPNRNECFNSGCATFLIMGNKCTRNCKFCNIHNGKPLPLDSQEPSHLAELALDMKLNHVVITSVTRDDLEDGGSSHFVKCVREVKKKLPGSTVEVLIPDFQGNHRALDKIISAQPEVINHNLETVPRLYPSVRPQADYSWSLDVLRYFRNNTGQIVKTGLILGMGEETEELEQVFSDLAEIGVHILTMGQYLQPSRKHYPVFRYVEPQEFNRLKTRAISLGIPVVVAGPLVRSSYQAHQAYLEIVEQD
ncbi:MAG: lipoyl synthase [bacterium]